MAANRTLQKVITFPVWLIIFILILALLPLSSQNSTFHLIEDLPGIRFKLNFKQYSGYLNVSRQDSQRFLHYWLIESQSPSPDDDPLVLWLNGGPGCSSLVGLFEEIGPFRPQRDGHMLYENVYSWNKVANILFLETPVGVGFSTVSPELHVLDDDGTAEDNYQALIEFYALHPKYSDRTFFIFGQSYCGVYIPTLAIRIINGTANNEFPGNFEGIAIGNGILSDKENTNSVVRYLYYHGIVGYDLWKQLNEACCADESPETCDYFSSLIYEGSLQYKGDSSVCGNLTYDITTKMIWFSKNNEYNLYFDCYENPSPKIERLLATMRFIFPQSKAPEEEFYLPVFFNEDTTDPFHGFPCWYENATMKYLNRPDVRKKLSLRPEASQIEWHNCNLLINEYSYKRRYFDMENEFSAILRSNVRILVYSGDADVACNFLGNGLFVERVADHNNLKVIQKREPWFYRGQVAGYAKKFKGIDLITIKGAGHFAPTDRPGPTLQMFVNFIRMASNYSTPTGLNTKLSPLSSGAQSIHGLSILALISGFWLILTVFSPTIGQGLS